MPKLALTTGPRWRNRSITYRLMVSCSVPDLENALVGMEGSDEFAVQMFDSLARKRGIVKEVLTNADLKEFWVQLSDQGFDDLLQTSINMVDKNADGRIASEEVKEIIALSASAIMEQLDPNDLGYKERSPVPCGFEADAGEEVKLTPVSRAGLGAYHDLGREGVKAAAAGGKADAGEEVRVAEVRAEVFQSKIQGNTQSCTILLQFFEFCLYMGNLEFRNYVVVNDVP